MALNAGEVSFLVVIKNRSIVRVEEAEGTIGKVTPLTAEQKQAYSKSSYGCRTVETIYETQQNPCFIMIGDQRIEVPCFG
jgi:hypothetical protein